MAEPTNTVEVTEAVAPIQIAKPVIFRPTMAMISHQKMEQPAFGAPRFDISQFVEEQANMPKHENRDEPIERPSIQTVVPTDRFMNIPQRKNRTEQTQRGIQLSNMRLR
jgi:hypothetical protein